MSRLGHVVTAAGNGVITHTCQLTNGAERATLPPDPSLNFQCDNPYVVISVSGQSLPSRSIQRPVSDIIIVRLVLNSRMQLNSGCSRSALRFTCVRARSQSDVDTE